ncbi:MAG: hypothetical protein DI539_17630 [Flavobacterium psychrophilum]|nr:MAG: hypothetical protein DI539_17630 [Flavobacterium psychrophilum]
MTYYITTSTPQNQTHFLLFKKGEETGFNYVYGHLYKPVLYYANRITGDEFANHTIVQEAFLRAWQFRERMTSMLHLFRFIRLCTRWGCYDYFRQPANRFYRQLIHPEHLEDFKAVAYYPETEDEQVAFSEIEMERINLVKDAIPYLPGDRQTIMTLYFKYGLSLKQIASRFAAPYQHISQEVQESIGALKSMILRIKMQEPACQISSGSSPPAQWKELLSDRQIQICQLRLEQQYGFDRIAQELNIPMWQALKEYVSAHEILKSAKR